MIRECDHQGLKKWRRSFCEATGKNARIQRMPDTTKQELLRACDIIGAAIKVNDKRQATVSK